ncbi:EsaB/YukD family protein [Streptomyces sp. NPDC048281]|uniref:EsaB/YukD family protein n=1 Tax=Streptomyces sp. NPDC048281 TaxID=3154715 RepID=UPI0034127AF7
MDQQCRITVVGEHRQVDLAVPVGVPITSYAGTLARLCGEAENDIMPAAWSLATALDVPFAPERSLWELGVVDGQVLYLRDVTEHEFDEPVVQDVTERVGEAARGLVERRWDARIRVITVLAVGLCWLIGVLVAIGARGQLGSSALTDVAVAAGLALPSLIWFSGERRWPVPPRLREVLALGAVPLLALAGWTLAGAGSDPGASGPGASASFTAAGLVVGAMAGAGLAYVAAPGVATCAVLVGSVLAAVVGSALALADADATEAVAVVAVAAFLLLTVALPTVGRIVAFTHRRASVRRPSGRDAGDDTDHDPVGAAVRGAVILLVVWTCVLASVLAVTLVALAASPSPPAAALAGCLGVALLLRAGAARLVGEVVPVGVAGAAGLCTLLLVGGGHLGGPGWAAPVYSCMFAVVLMVYGFRSLMGSPGLLLSGRPSWFTGVSSVLGGAAVGLAFATFGAFDWIIDFGRGL